MCLLALESIAKHEMASCFEQPAISVLKILISPCSARDGKRCVTKRNPFKMSYPNSCQLLKNSFKIYNFNKVSTIVRVACTRENGRAVTALNLQVPWLWPGEWSLLVPLDLKVLKSSNRNRRLQTMGLEAANINRAPSGFIVKKVPALVTEGM